MHPVALRQVQQLLAIFHLQRHRFLRPDMAFRLQGLFVDREMRRHRRGVNQEVKGRARQHLVNIGIHVWDLELLGPFLGAFNDDVAHADHLDEWLRGKVRQIGAGYISAANFAHSDLASFR